MGEIRNYIKLILIGVAILVTVTMIISATGCDILPPPASAIKPPQYINASSGEVEDPKAIARRFLTPGRIFHILPIPGMLMPFGRLTLTETVGRSC